MKRILLKSLSIFVAAILCMASPRATAVPVLVPVILIGATSIFFYGSIAYIAYWNGYAWIVTSQNANPLPPLPPGIIPPGMYNPDGTPVNPTVGLPNINPLLVPVPASPMPDPGSDNRLGFNYPNNPTGTNPF